MFQDFPEYYVTAEGKLMSAARSVRKVNGQWQKVPEKELKGSVNREGYLTVALYGKQRKTCSLHRLIALALVPGYAAGLDVNHKDGNKLNNHPDNLEWVTKSYNTKHAHDTGLILPTRTRKLTLEQKQRIGELKGEVPAAHLAQKYGVSKWTIYGTWTRFA